jgi:hypothetical protein
MPSRHGNFDNTFLERARDVFDVGGLQDLAKLRRGQAAQFAESPSNHFSAFEALAPYKADLATNRAAQAAGDRTTALVGGATLGTAGLIGYGVNEAYEANKPWHQRLGQ